MEIGVYEDWMRPQVAKMFSLQYGLNENDFSKLIEDFYEHPYQKDRCLRIVAKEEDRVIGFQSFFYWPYRFNNKIYNSFQSGNSLVHPEFRGKGIFQKLLTYIDTHSRKLGIDFLIGFPVEASKKSFIRNQWENILNLQWHIKIINPLSFFFSLRLQELHNVFNTPSYTLDGNSSSFRLASNPDFSSWRNHYSKEGRYLYFSFAQQNYSANFTLKFIKRRKYINELIIGDFQCNTNDLTFIHEAFNTLIRKARSLRFLSILTIAINERSSYSLLKPLLQSGFKKTNKKIYFIIKDFSNNQAIHNPESWTLYRSDIDTW
ncbi:MAG: GNAT family N-acetyltransferase [Bacteroidetes bacterium]|nr:GNAT family N-acetyltransferase [Bacteroidota bacterium]